MVPRRRRVRRTLWRTLLTLLVVVPAVGGVVLPHVGDDLETPLGARGVGEGTFPVVLVAGLASNGAGFGPLIARLADAGVPVLDLDPERPGTQPFRFFPRRASDRVETIARDQLAPAVLAAVARAGMDPVTQRVDVVAHSYGGLLARWLVEREGWAPRVDDLVLVATPHRGSEFGFRLATLGGGHEEWDAVGSDIRPGSPALRALATREPPGETYTTIGGDPVALRWLRIDGHGFDGTVPAASALLPGAAQRLLPFTHGRLLRSGRALALIERTLRATP